MRSRDFCTAAFYDDVQRIKQLIRAALPSEDEEEEEEAVNQTEEDEEDMEEEQLSIHRLQRMRKRREVIASLLCKPGLLRTVETGEEYGFTFRVDEVPATAGDGGRCLNPQFKVSRRSRFPAAPLHWAALGRSHRAVEFLVSSGVDVQQEVPGFPKLTASAICAFNKSFDTARLLEKASEAYQRRLEKEEEQRCKWVEDLENKKRERERLAALEEQEEHEDDDEEKMNEHSDEDDYPDDDGADANNDEEDTGVE